MFRLFFSFNTFSQNNSDSLIRQLLAATSNDTRVEFIFQLAEIGENEISTSNRKSIEEKLLKWYRNEPDAGLHSAIDFLFRNSKKGEVPRKMNWNLAQELERIQNLRLAYKPKHKICTCIWQTPHRHPPIAKGKRKAPQGREKILFYNFDNPFF